MHHNPTFNIFKEKSFLKCLYLKKKKVEPCTDYPSCQLISTKMFESYCIRNTLRNMCPSFCDKNCKNDTTKLLLGTTGIVASSKSTPIQVDSSASVSAESSSKEQQDLSTSTEVTTHQQFKPGTKPNIKKPYKKKVS